MAVVGGEVGVEREVDEVFPSSFCLPLAPCLSMLSSSQQGWPSRFPPFSPCRSIEQYVLVKRAAAAESESFPARQKQRQGGIERGACPSEFLSLFVCLFAASSSSHRASKKEFPMFVHALLRGRSLVFLVASRAPGTRTQSLCESAQAEGGFECSSLGGEEGGSSFSSSLVAGKQKSKKKPTPLTAFRSRARRLQPLDAPFIALARPREHPRLSRARLFGKKRRAHHAGKGGERMLVFLREKKQTPFARPVRERKKGTARRQRRGNLPSPPPLPPPPAGTANSKGERSWLLSPQLPHLPADDDDRGQHVPQAGQGPVPARDVAERRRGGLQAVDERQHRLHPFGRHCRLCLVVLSPGAHESGEKGGTARKERGPGKSLLLSLLLLLLLLSGQKSFELRAVQESRKMRGFFSGSSLFFLTSAPSNSPLSPLFSFLHAFPSSKALALSSLRSQLASLSR